MVGTTTATSGHLRHCCPTIGWSTTKICLAHAWLLERVLPERWLWRDSEASPAPFAWPPRSPDLTIPDNALWGVHQGESPQNAVYGQLSKKSSLTWPRIICAKHLPEHGAEFNCATTMKVSIPMFWTLKPSGTCPYQALNYNRYSVENKRGCTPTSLVVSCRSQWPLGLRHEPSSSALTLGSWVRIPLGAWMSVWVYFVFVLLCV
jgi:hypothetical protein